MSQTQNASDSIEPALLVTPVNTTEAESKSSNNESCPEFLSAPAVIKRNCCLQILSRLSPDVRRRVRALRKLQLKTNAIEMEFNAKIFEFEKEFQEKHQEIMSKRFEIVSGGYEPNDEECDFPDPNLLQRIDENISMLGRTEGHSDQIKGIPNFWLHIFYTNPMLDYITHEGDDDILHHLVDIRVIYKSEPHLAFVLEFEFSENPYFENTVLTKEYLLKIKFDNVVLYEGPEIFKAVGCDIKWKNDKKTVQPSFLDFFNPPALPSDQMDAKYEEVKNVLESDFEIGNYIKEQIVPKAILYYTGECHNYDYGRCSDSSDGGEDSEDEEKEEKPVELAKE